MKNTSKTAKATLPATKTAKLRTGVKAGPANAKGSCDFGGGRRGNQTSQGCLRSGH